MQFIVKSFTFNDFQENTYVLYTEDKDCLIIDPGCSTREERKILKDFILQRELKPIKLINTHCHIDHIYGDAFVQEEWGLPLLIHSGEQKVLDATQQLADLYGMPRPQLPRDIVYLDQMEDIPFNQEKIRILFTPGHSPAHISLYHEKSKILLCGDVLFRESIGRTDLPGGDSATLLNSIKEKLWVLPDNTQVFPGHGPSTSIGYEKVNNPFL